MRRRRLALTDDSEPNRYLGYFENEHGEQAIFVYDRTGCLSAGPLLPVTPSPADDVELAARLGIDIERIAVLRRRPGVALVALLDGSAPVAFGAFDPAFPDIYPACVASPDVARSLLEACRPHARHDHVNATPTPTPTPTGAASTAYAAGGAILSGWIPQRTCSRACAASPGP